MNSNNYVIAKEEKNQLLLLCLPKLKEFLKINKNYEIFTRSRCYRINRNNKEFGVIEYKTSFLF